MPVVAEVSVAVDVVADVVSVGAVVVVLSVGSECEVVVGDVVSVGEVPVVPVVVPVAPVVPIVEGLEPVAI